MRKESDIRRVFEKAVKRSDDVSRGAYASAGQQQFIGAVRAVLGWVLEEYDEEPDLGMTSHDD